MLDDALRTGASLATFAERGRVVPELGDPAIREVFVYKYRLQYEVQDLGVLTVRSFTARGTSPLRRIARTWSSGSINRSQR
jgi:plasmid stabilization system protein ParE